MRSYLVVELQTFQNGQIATNSFGYADPTMTDKERELQAKAKMHDLLAVAALSSLPVHAVSLLDNSGSRVDGGCFVHEVNE